MEKVKPHFSQFEAVIFDMDGVLIDSEPLWKIAMQEVFDSIGCSLTKKDFQKTVGLRIDEVIAYWFAHSPWENTSPKEVEEQIIQKMIVLIQQNGEPLEGVVETLQFLKSKQIKIGLGTSSYLVLIETVLNTLDIAHFFDAKHSAETETHGKPHPAVYLSVAQSLTVNPRNCLVIEDSFTGFIAGKSAGMQVCVIPEKTHEPNLKLQAADFIYTTMADFLADFQ
ncbi:MAG: hexitol phosphatase HxpB [Bacteroidetes bacterium]|nr:hexitol phosphatase HxpB [Bacteroidota bacterium]